MVTQVSAEPRARAEISENCYASAAEFAGPDFRPVGYCSATLERHNSEIQCETIRNLAHPDG